MISLVAFDMAGTTVDEGSAVYAALQSAVEHQTDREVPADLLGKWKGTGKRQAVEGLLRDLGGDPDPAVVDRVFDDMSDRLLLAYRDRPPVPIEGIPELFTRLHDDGVAIALQTGYSQRIAHSILDVVGWRVGDQIDALVTSDQVELSRPAPYLIFKAMELTRTTSTRDVLTAGDTPNDVRAGRHAGAGVVTAVLSGAYGRDALAAEGPDLILSSLAELSPAHLAPVPV